MSDDWDDGMVDSSCYYDMMDQRDELEAEVARLRAALEAILSLQPLKTQHEHHIAMLKTLDIIRKALAKEGK